MDLMKKLSKKAKERKSSVVAVSEEVIEQPEEQPEPTQDSSLIHFMNVLLSSEFCFYFQAHTFHWNVEGINFTEYHDLFSKIYSQVFDFVDVIAEQIRALDEFPVSNLNLVLDLSPVKPNNTESNPRDMVKSLLLNNGLIIQSATLAYDLAEKQNKLGLSNFLQDLIDKHNKIGWMLRASSKGE